MKPRHAAALALVGWYLMVPPDPASELATLEPLHWWFQIGSFDSANGCQEARRMMIGRFMTDLQKDYRDTTAVHGMDAFYYSECIATDDPRIKLIPATPVPKTGKPN